MNSWESIGIHGNMEAGKAIGIHGNWEAGVHTVTSRAGVHLAILLTEGKNPIWQGHVWGIVTITITILLELLLKFY